MALLTLEELHLSFGGVAALAGVSLQVDAGDFFANVEGDALTAETTPSSLLWDGSDSGLRVKTISAPGATMRMTVYVDDKANG